MSRALTRVLARKGARKGRLLAAGALLVVLLVVLLAVLAGPALGAKTPTVPSHGLWHHPTGTQGTATDFVPGEVLVTFAPGSTGSEVAGAASEAGSAAVENLTAPNAGMLRSSRYLLKSGSHSTAEMIATLSKHSGVVSVSPNYRLYATGAWSGIPPSDALFAQQWDLNNTGQTAGLPDADIDALEAWAVSTGSANVVVADIDTGISYDHPDLAANVWHNPGEIPNNSTDDDGNGIVDDYYGINAYAGGTDPLDDSGHGTHTAGTIAAVSDNGVGVAGIGWNTQVMGLKFLGGSAGSGTSSGAIQCINYAIMMKGRGVNVVAINASWGGGGFDANLKAAIDAAGAAGIIFCSAAGNNGVNSDTSLFYPAAYASSNLVSVGATDSSDKKASWSNYGATSVDLFAPGVSCVSTFLNGGYASYSGTSMATPHVTGAIAVLASLYPGDSVAARINRVLSTVDKISTLSGQCVTGGRLNLASALGLGSGTTYTISAQVSSGASTGSVVVSRGQVASGACTSVNIAPAAYYAVDSVTDVYDGSSHDVTGSVPAAGGAYAINGVGSNHAITVRFKSTVPLYAVTASSNDITRGTVSPATQQVASGSTATATVTPIAPAVLLKLTDTVGGVTTDVTSKVSGGVYTMTNVTAAHQIAATFGPKTTVTRYEQTNTNLKFSGTWTRVYASSASGGNYSYTNTSGGYVTIAFYGTAVNVLLTKGTAYGNANIYLDGATTPTATVDLYASTTTYKVSVFSRTGLTPGNHTVKIGRAGTKNTRATSYRISMDAVDITGTLIKAS